MANKIHIPYYKISNTIYVTIRNENGNVWNTSSKAFVVWSDLSIANYVINSTYKEGSLYIAEFPVDIPKGYYTVMIFLQSGVSPNASADVWLGTSNYYWDKENNNLVGVRVDSLIEYSSGERFTEKALEIVSSLISASININHDTTQTTIERESSPSSIIIQRESNPT